MDDDSTTASGSASTPDKMATKESTLSLYTTHLDWGSKEWTFSLYIRKYSWELLPLCFDSLLQIVLIVSCAGILFTRLSSGTIDILLGFKLVSSLDFTIIFFWMLTWGSGRYSPPDLGITGNWLEYFFGPGRYDVVFVVILFTLGRPYC